MTIEPTCTIRPASIEDIPFIRNIFNHAIQHTTASFYYEPRTIEQRTKWLLERPERNEVFVLIDSGTVVGWAALDPFSPKNGYQITSEISYYVDADHHGRGFGTLLVEHLILAGKQHGFRNLLAKICENNLVSIRLAERFGFEKVGSLKSIGEKFGNYYDVHYFQKVLS